MSYLTYVTGGTRSGKSSYAQARAEAIEGELLYVATAGIHDAEMEERVRLHQEVRGGRWTTLEEPLDLTQRLPGEALGKSAIMLDCITLWVTNLFFHYKEEREPVISEVKTFLESLKAVEAPLFMVSNELGMGIVPENKLARTFRDLAGEVNQIIAAASDEAWLVASGLPLRLK